MTPEDVYRSDLIAAQARIAVLEAEVAALRGELTGEARKRRARFMARLVRVMRVVWTVVVCAAALVGAGLAARAGCRAHRESAKVVFCYSVPAYVTNSHGEVTYIPRNSWLLMGHVDSNFVEDKVLARGTTREQVEAEAARINCPVYDTPGARR